MNYFHQYMRTVEFWTAFFAEYSKRLNLANTNSPVVNSTASPQLNEYDDLQQHRSCVDCNCNHQSHMNAENMSYTTDDSYSTTSSSYYSPASSASSTSSTTRTSSINSSSGSGNNCIENVSFKDRQKRFNRYVKKRFIDEFGPIEFLSYKMLKRHESNIMDRIKFEAKEKFLPIGICESEFKAFWKSALNTIRQTRYRYRSKQNRNGLHLSVL